MVRWSNAPIVAILASAAILAIVYIGLSYFLFETFGIIPDRVVGIQLDLALPRIAVLIGAPSVLAVLLVLAIIRLRYKLSFAIKRKDRAD